MGGMAMATDVSEKGPETLMIHFVNSTCTIWDCREKLSNRFTSDPGGSRCRSLVP